MYADQIYWLTQTRVEQSQGEIIIDSSGRGMVNGRLAMTRSIGDLELKPFGVTAVPDVRKLKVFYLFFVQYLYVKISKPWNLNWEWSKCN